MTLRHLIMLLISNIYLSINCKGQYWNDVGGGVTFDTSNTAYAYIESMEVYNGELYVGGGFTMAGNTPAYSLARWNGSVWDSVGLGFGPNCGGTLNDFCVYNSELYAGGSFLGMCSGLPWPNNYIPGCKNFAKWDGSNWSSASPVTPGDQLSISEIKCLAVYNNELYAGGNFVQVGNLSVNRIAKWNGVSWDNVGGGVTGGFGYVECMTVYNGSLYVGGDFSYAGGIPAQNIARWNGSQWDSVGSAFGALNGVPRVLLADTFNHALVAGGSFSLAGGNLALGVAEWNDSSWSGLGNDTLIGIVDLGIYHNELYGGHHFTNFYKWDGSSWNYLADVNNTITSLKVFNDELYIAGYFDSINGIPFSRIARFSILNSNSNNSFGENLLFNIYPNPALSSITIDLKSGTSEQFCSIVFLNSLGVPEKEIEVLDFIREPDCAIEFSIKELKTGLHFIGLRTTNESLVGIQKFIKF
ncbi:MAG: hypothetical protein ABI763_13245 [Bacteroidota bacterium]